MNRKPLIATILALTLGTLACGVNFEVPVTDIKTGPTQTVDISVPLLDDSDAVADISLVFGAGDLELTPGAEDALVSGEATFNVEDFEPIITIDGSNIRIEQGDLNVRGIPDFQDDMMNEWALLLGSAPMFLHLNAGAYIGDFELGGLSLRGLDISDGAADVELSFSEPNLVEMDSFTYNTGASNVSITGLANANTASVIFRSGAGSYTLDFGGELQQDMDVSIESGISSITVIVPEGVSAEVTYDGGMSNISLDGSWKKSEGIYVQEGEGFTIKITVKMGAGNLELKNK
jgi:hypothetical protein